MCYGFDGDGALDEATGRNGMDRRRLMKTLVGTAAAGALAFGAPGTAAAAGRSEEHRGRPRPGRRRVDPNKISIQLYSIRDDLAVDYRSSLRYVADAGYRKVEQGGYYGQSVREVRRFHDRIGIRTSSSHDNLSSTRTALYEKLDNANILGQRYIVVPYLANDDPEQWKRWAYQMNSEAAAAQREGLRYGYHNHAHEFLPLVNGERPWDILCAELDPVLVHFEVDLYWIATGAIQSGDGVDDPEGVHRAAPRRLTARGPAVPREGPRSRHRRHVRPRHGQPGLRADLRAPPGRGVHRRERPAQRHTTADRGGRLRLPPRPAVLTGAVSPSGASRPRRRPRAG